LIAIVGMRTLRRMDTKPSAAEWHDAPPDGDFASLLGPLQRRRTDGHWVYRMRVQEKHRNAGGVMHGGALTALIDEVAGNTVHELAAGPHVTVQLSTTFLRRVQPGDIIESDCTIVRRTRSMTFIEVRLRVGEEVVATASLIFKAIRGTTPQS
jgi:uncharacterized protein (TIGR00369 family)